MQIKGLVSCVIPTYKRSDTLQRAVDSVLNQTYRNIEVLVVDDNVKGSKESEIVAGIIDKIKDSRVHLVLQEKHINGAEARNAGVRASQGEYIGFLDDDDVWLPEKIEKQLKFIESRGDIDGCSVLYNEYMGGALVHSCPVYTEDNLFYKIFRREVAVFTSTVLLKKDSLIEAGLFDINLKRHQDLQLLLRFTDRYKMGVLPEYLVQLHNDSAINRPNAQTIVDIKKNFFNSVSDLYQKCSKKDKRLIKSAHCYEVMIAALKQKKLALGFSYFLKAGFHIVCIELLLKRMKDRKYKTES